MRQCIFARRADLRLALTIFICWIPHVTKKYAVYKYLSRKTNLPEMYGYRSDANRGFYCCRNRRASFFVHKISCSGLKQYAMRGVGVWKLARSAPEQENADGGHRVRHGHVRPMHQTGQCFMAGQLLWALIFGARAEGKAPGGRHVAEVAIMQYRLWSMQKII